MGNGDVIFAGYSWKNDNCEYASTQVPVVTLGLVYTYMISGVEGDIYALCNHVVLLITRMNVGAILIQFSIVYPGTHAASRRYYLGRSEICVCVQMCSTMN